MSDAEKRDKGSAPSGGAEKERVSRKQFFTTAGWAACLGTVTLSIIGSLRSAIPSLLPDASQKFKIGKIVDFRPGTTRDFPEENVLVYSTDEGMYALSKVCTHLGCIVNQEGSGFQCPCHGSKYNADGEVTRGPAPRSLSWLYVERLPNGELVVDRGKPVATGTKFSLDIEQA